MGGTAGGDGGGGGGCGGASPADVTEVAHAAVVAVAADAAGEEKPSVTAFTPLGAAHETEVPLCVEDGNLDASCIRSVWNHAISNTPLPG